MSTALRAKYLEQGYVIVPDLIDPLDLPDLQEATERAIQKTRAGQWTHARVVGKQFPPFGKGDDFWGVQHLMHPDLHEPAFVRWYGSPKLLSVAAELLDCTENELQMELFNMLINPSKKNFALRWHRDDVREDATEEEEVEALKINPHGIQWNTALLPDSSLWVVPGSHAVPRSLSQRAESSTLDPPKDMRDMPGAVQLHLKPGETVFYVNNILHTASYNPSVPRATLHGCIGDVRGGSTRARMILQHGLTWMRTDDFGRQIESIRPELRPMWARLITMADGVKGDLGYSLVG